MAAWEYDLLLRKRINSHLNYIHTTLSSLYNLLDEAPHLPISDDIANNVTKAVNILDTITTYTHNVCYHHNVNVYNMLLFN